MVKGKTGRAVALAVTSSLFCVFFVPGAMGAENPPDSNSSVSISMINPKIFSVLPGATKDSLVVRYQLLDPRVPSPDSLSAISYELSLDALTWWTCEQPSDLEISSLSASCNLSDLQPLRTYGVFLRAVERELDDSGSLSVTGTSLVAGPEIGTTQIPRELDPDKPAELQSPRAVVTANFDAASNSLGVNAAKRSVGVGTLPKITFSRAIPNKAAVERHVVVSAQDQGGVVRPVVGAWGWVSDRSAVFRPKAYWPGNSTIRIVSDLEKVVLGKSGSVTLVGSKGLGTTFVFTTARKFIAHVNGATKTMKVFVDGNRVQTFYVSLGKKDWETRNGTKVVSTAKEAMKVYRSEALGLTAPEDQYELEAPWNTRLTPTGEFLHAAPWAYGRLGQFNGSHGCTNMFEKDAEWIYRNTIPGDIVYFSETGGDVVEPWNGPGGLWNIPWAKWLKKSALASGTNSVNSDANIGSGSMETAKPAGV